jgi:hypothetical protein
MGRFDRYKPNSEAEHVRKAKEAAEVTHSIGWAAWSNLYNLEYMYNIICFVCILYYIILYYIIYIYTLAIYILYIYTYVHMCDYLVI